MRRALQNIYQVAHDILLKPECAWKLATLIILGDAVLSQLIIRFISYTEIDWETYMYHIDLVNEGERNYTSIVGPTGPLVYPAGHVYIYSALHKITDSGKNIFLAQQLFALLYTISLAVICLIYIRSRSIPNYVLLLLPLSKRLHSIYMLRLFNDCWSVVCMHFSVLAFGAGWDSFGVLIFSLALSVKMSALLYAPGIAILLWRRRGVAWSVAYAVLIIVSQVFIGGPFLREFPREYLVQAFDLSRVFLFKWTVNWRFLGEELFLHPLWAKVLLLGHVATLVVWAQTIWCKDQGGIVPMLRKSLREVATPASRRIDTSDYITVLLSSSNLIGIIFARSLHYQFYSWYAQYTPFLAWHTPYPVFVKIVLLLSIEYAWNVYPSTDLSSAILLVANFSLLTGVWYRQSKYISTAIRSGEKLD